MTGQSELKNRRQFINSNLNFIGPLEGLLYNLLNFLYLVSKKGVNFTSPQFHKFYFYSKLYLIYKEKDALKSMPL